MKKLILSLLAVLALAGSAQAQTCDGESVFPLLASTQDNLPVASVGVRPCVVRLNAGAAATITGLAGGVPGERLTLLVASGSSAITLSNASTSSTFGNRFAVGASVTLAAGDVITLQYSSLASAWIQIGRHVSNSAISGNLAVTGTTTLTGALVSPFVLGAAGQAVEAWGTLALTEAAGAQTIFTVTTATTQMTGGTIEYVLSIADSAGSPDYTIRAGHLQFNMSNTAGTVICTGDASDQSNDDSFLTQQGTAKTNTYAITFVTGANTCAVKFNMDSDIATVTSSTITWILRLNGPGTIS